MRSEYLDADPCHRVRFREEPDEEEEEEKRKRKRRRKTKVTPKKGMMMTTKIAATRCERAFICRRVKDEARTFHQGC
jgi:hypothetical protein